MVTSSSESLQDNKFSSEKHVIQEDKVDEVKAPIARYLLYRIEQKKIEAKLAKITKYSDDESLRTIFEPIGESMVGVMGLELPQNRKK